MSSSFAQTVLGLWPALVAGVAVVGALLWLWRANRRAYVVPYLYFLRYPLLAALFMIAFPFLAITTAARSSLANLYVLDALGLALVAFLAVLTSFSIFHTALLLWLAVPKRVRLAYLRDPDAEPGATPLCGRHGSRMCAPILAGPTLVVGFVYADAGTGVAALAIVLGVGAALLFRWFTMWGGALVSGRGSSSADEPRDTTVETPRSAADGDDASTPWLQHVADSVDDALDQADRMYFPRRELAGVSPPLGASAGGEILSVRTSLLFLLATVAFYSSGYVFFDPLSPLVPPALVFVFLLVMLLTKVLSAAAFVLDVYRVPVGIVLVTIISLTYLVAGVDHFFDIGPLLDDDWITSEELVIGWHERHRDAEPPAAVVVAISGGGITAARWGAEVIRQLGTHPQLGPQFLSSIVLLSTVSGGSIPAMHLVEGYTVDGPPVEAALEELVDVSSRSSLAATAWGITYPDFFRLIPGVAFVEPHDRAVALERVWADRLGTAGRPTFGDWLPGLREGWRPAAVFNATIAESGQRLRFTPVEFSNTAAYKTGSRRAVGSHTLYENADLAVATAARLSATFPWVSPIARPRARDEESQRLLAGRHYHVADGGYYDNFGALSALEFIQSVADKLAQLGHRRVLFMQIAATDLGMTEPPSVHGWYWEIVGPTATMNSVRTTSQIVRNNWEFTVLQTVYEDTLRLERIMFELGDEGPLSWHLSRQEKERISCRWPMNTDSCTSLLGRLSREQREDFEATRARNQEALDALVDFWEGVAPPKSSLTLAPLEDASKKVLEQIMQRAQNGGSTAFEAFSR